jgi:hypothetical protein
MARGCGCGASFKGGKRGVRLCPHCDAPCPLRPCPKCKAIGVKAGEVFPPAVGDTPPTLGATPPTPAEDRPPVIDDRPPRLEPPAG